LGETIIRRFALISTIRLLACVSSISCLWLVAETSVSLDLYTCPPCDLGTLLTWQLLGALLAGGRGPSGSHHLLQSQKGCNAPTPGRHSVMKRAQYHLALKNAVPA
jgi:hypothetical protein